MGQDLNGDVKEAAGYVNLDLRGCPFLFQGTSQARNQTCIYCIAGGFFTTEQPGKPLDSGFLCLAWCF